MGPQRERWLDRVQDRYQPTGILATLEDPRLGVRVMLANCLVPPVLILLSILGCWALDESGVAWVLTGFLAAQLVAAGTFLGQGDARRAVLIQLWALLLASTVCHALLGGFVWSGGSLLYGIAVATGAALFIDRRTAYLLMAVCLAVAAVMVPLEPVLQGRRDQPLLGLSLFVMVTLYVAILVLLVPSVVATVDRLRYEQDRNRALLLNVLPASVADRLKAEPGLIADAFGSCSILFADLVGFTSHAHSQRADRVVAELNTVFTRFDSLVAAHGAEKIKTIGDGYLVACGLPDPDPGHVTSACRVALALRDAMPDLNATLGTDFQLRIGVHTGQAVAGVIGTTKFSYDVWGDTVNLASRLESTGVPGTICVSAEVVAAATHDFRFEPAGRREMKGRGQVDVYHLLAPATARI